MSRLITFILLIGALPVFAQFEGLEKGAPWHERVFMGGGMDLAFDNFLLVVGASPSLGYMITPTTGVGAGITYRYIRFQQNGESGNVLGYRFFIQQMLFKNIFAYAEWENLGYKDFINTTRLWDNRTHVGGGIFQPISDRAGFVAIVMYRVSTSAAQDQFNSPLSYRAGLTFSPFR